MINKVITLSKLLTAYTFHFLSCGFPRSKKVWVFIGWHTNVEREVFADNSKYLYLYTANQLPEVSAIWISHDRKLSKILSNNGYTAYYLYSLKGIFYSLRAEYTFVDAFMKLRNWQFSGRSKVIQLWHGKGMKKTGHDSNYSLKKYDQILFPHLHQKFYKLIASSPYTVKLMASTFKAKVEDILITGLPRNDILHSNISGSDIDSHQQLANQITDAKKNGCTKILFYAPTFRPDGSNPLESFDFIKANEFLADKNWHLIVSLHPKFARKENVQIPSLSNISYVGAGYDIYPQLKDIDLLITDYSSLYVDFLQLSKPVVFYVFDILQYQSEMGLHEDFETLTPGPHPRTFNDLLEAINLPISSKYQVVKEYLHTYSDGESSTRVAKYFLEA